MARHQHRIMALQRIDIRGAAYETRDGHEWSPVLARQIPGDRMRGRNNVAMGSECGRCDNVVCLAIGIAGYAKHRRPDIVLELKRPFQMAEVGYPHRDI